MESQNSSRGQASRVVFEIVAAAFEAVIPVDEEEVEARKLPGKLMGVALMDMDPYAWRDGGEVFFKLVEELIVTLAAFIDHFTFGLPVRVERVDAMDFAAAQALRETEGALSFPASDFQNDWVAVSGPGSGLGDFEEAGRFGGGQPAVDGFIALKLTLVGFGAELIGEIAEGAERVHNWELAAWKAGGEGIEVRSGLLVEEGEIGRRLLTVGAVLIREIEYGKCETLSGGNLLPVMIQ